MTDPQRPNPLEEPIDIDLAHIVDLTASVEGRLNDAIELFLSPRRGASRFFRDVLMDSSVLPLGSKVRIVAAISQAVKFKLDTKALHSLIAARNAFAHHPTASHPVITVGLQPQDTTIHYELHILTSSGRVLRRKREEALHEFAASYQASCASIEGLLKAINQSVGDAT